MDCKILGRRQFRHVTVLQDYPHCHNAQNCLTARRPHRASLAAVCIKSRASDRLQQNPSTIDREAKSAAPTAQATRAPLASLNCSRPRRSSSSPASSRLSPSVTWPSPLATCLSPLATCLSPWAICSRASLKPFPPCSSLSANTKNGLSLACLYSFLPSANSRLPASNFALPASNFALPASSAACPWSSCLCPSAICLSPAVIFSVR